MGTAQILTMKKSFHRATTWKNSTFNWGIGKGEKEVYINHLASWILVLKRGLKQKSDCFPGVSGRR